MVTQTRIISNRSKAEVQCDSSGAGVWSLCCGEGFDAFFQHGVRANGLEPGRSGSACFPLGMNIDACIPHITTSWKVPFAWGAELFLQTVLPFHILPPFCHYIQSYEVDFLWDCKRLLAVQGLATGYQKGAGIVLHVLVHLTVMVALFGIA